MRRKFIGLVLMMSLMSALAWTENLGHFTVAYGGGACEAPVVVALHKGFFKAEGLDAELVKVTDFESEKTALSSNKINAGVGNFGWFKAIEQGFAVKLTGGIHAGCIKFVVPNGSSIKSLKDVKGKTIGIDAIGSGPQIDLSIALRNAGLNPKTDVSWRAYPPPELSQAAKKKEIDAFVVWDPFATFAVEKEGYTTLLDIAKDEPFKSGYCCYSVVSKILFDKEPKKAAAFTKAILKAAKWVGENPQESAQIELEEHEPGDLATLTKLIASYYWRPSIERARQNAKFFIAEQKKDGILEASTNEDKLLERLFGVAVSDKDLNL